MKTKRTTAERCRLPGTVALALAILSAAACDTDSPVVPDTELEALQAAVVGGGPDVIASVKGGGHFQLKDPPSFVGDFQWFYRFNVDAKKLADGSDVGTVRFSSHLPPGRNNQGVDLDWWAVVEIDCVEIEGNTAWLTGAIVRARTESPAGPAVGSGTAMFIIEDNGPAGNDQVNVGPAVVFGGATDCRDRPPLVGDALTDGNFHVSGGA